VKIYKGSIYGRLLDYTDSIGLYIVGIICSIISGASHPGAALILSYALDSAGNIYKKGITTNWCHNSDVNF